MSIENICRKNCFFDDGGLGNEKLDPCITSHILVAVNEQFFYDKIYSFNYLLSNDALSDLVTLDYKHITPEAANCLLKSLIRDDAVP